MTECDASYELWRSQAAVPPKRYFNAFMKASTLPTLPLLQIFGPAFLNKFHTKNKELIDGKLVTIATANLTTSFPVAS